MSQCILYILLFRNTLNRTDLNITEKKRFYAATKQNDFRGRSYLNSIYITEKKNRLGKDEYWQEQIKLPCLDNFCEKGQRPDVVLKPERHRQGKRSLHSRIHPGLDGIKFYPCRNLPLPSRFFAVV